MRISFEKIKIQITTKITFWLLVSLDRIISNRSSDKAELLFGLRYISPTMFFLLVLTVSINIDSNLPSSNLARSSLILNYIASFMYKQTPVLRIFMRFY